jgi:hypothetical protein
MSKALPSPPNLASRSGEYHKKVSMGAATRIFSGGGIMVSTLEDLSQSLLGLYRNGSTHPVARESGPPPRIDGHVIGTVMARATPHTAKE